jgi:exonuclease SbcC
MLKKELDALQSVNDVIERKIEIAEISLPAYDESIHVKKRDEWMRKSAKVNNAQMETQQIQKDLQKLETLLTELSEKIQEGEEIHEEAEKSKRVIEELQRIRGGCRAVLPTLRTLYLKSIERNIQKMYNDVNPTSSFTIQIDEDYTPTMSVGSYSRSYRDLSGGERTEIALAYRIGLGNAIYEARTGVPMELLILDEPTENLGNEEEDRAIERLATMLSNLRIRQIIVVTHDQTFTQFADKTIQIKKIGNQSSFT